MLCGRSLIPWVMLVCFLGLSCSKPNVVPNRIETVPVKGLVLVDGQPLADVTIDLHSVAATDPNKVVKPTTKTKENGTFEFSMYEAGDGVPEGEYAATFFCRKFSMLSRSYVGPDKLKDRYVDPKQSKTRFKVEKGKPVDLGKIELTTK